jgi:hypothetical protein
METAYKLLDNDDGIPDTIEAKEISTKQYSRHRYE